MSLDVVDARTPLRIAAAAAQRIVASWHVAWSINSVTHRFGYRNCETNQDSRNNLVVGLISDGEGRYNHHADPRAARYAPVDDSSGRRTTRGGDDMPPEAVAIAKN